jgi:HlyD family secretion protein
MKNNRNPRLFYPICIFALTILATGCVFQSAPANTSITTTIPVIQAPAGVVAEGHVVPRDFTNLAFLTGGNVLEVLVTEGQVVSKGDVLIRLDDRAQYDSAVSSAQLELTNAQQALSHLQEKADLMSAQAQVSLYEAKQNYIDAQRALEAIDTDAFQQRIDDARQKVADAKTARDDAQTELAKYADMDPNNSTRKNAEDTLTSAQDKYDTAVHDRDALINQLDQARAAQTAAQSAMDDAQRTVDNHSQGPDPDELALAQGRVDQATAQLNAAQEALNRLILTAPYDGTVVELKVSAGENVYPNQAVLVFADLSTLYVETSDLTEMDVVNVKVGDQTTITVDALPSITLQGTVESISENYSERGGDIVYKVRIQLIEPDPLLRWGMTVEVKDEGK